jgi:very-short-patch-repair endonuclease
MLPSRPGKGPLRVYAAGRIAANDWRSRIGLARNPCNEDTDFLDDGFPEVQGVTDAGVSYIYTGPFYSAGVRGHHYDAVESVHSVNFADGRHDNFGDTGRHKLFSECLAAIDRSDVVFGNLEEHAYGTVFELGYAQAKYKHIAINGNSAELDGDLWFPARSGERLTSVLPEKAFAETVNRLTPAPALCESPVEQLLLDTFVEYGFSYSHTNKSFTHEYDKHISITPQFQVGKYRLDFLVANKKSKVNIDVEVDGFEYHERTKDQASRDKERDRYMQTGGYLVFRYTGSDVHRHPQKCAAEVLKIARSHGDAPPAIFLP